MTAETIEKFKPVLEPLELERLRILRDRKAILFAMLLCFALGFLLICSGLWAQSRSVVGFGFALFFGCAALAWVRSHEAEKFRAKLRGRFTREWFGAVHPGCYLATAPSVEQIPLDVTRSLREACIRATAQSPSRTAIEERIFFDNDTYHTWTFVLRERGIFGGVKSRALVWFRVISEENGIVAYVWPPLGLARAPEIRFFKDGKPTESFEPLRAKLLSLYDRLRANAKGLEVRVSLSPNGLWAGVRLEGELFAPPAISKSLLDSSSFASWSEDALLPIDREITRF